jgi:hypothetical protein
MKGTNKQDEEKIKITAELRNFYLLQNVQTCCGDTLSLLFNGYQGSLPGVVRHPLSNRKLKDTDYHVL